MSGPLATAGHLITVIAGSVRTAFAYLADIPANRLVPAGTFLLYIAGTVVAAFILFKIIGKKKAKG